jgi:hypothetical protein
MGLLKSVDKSIMDALTPQRVLDIYATLTANAQIERFSARNQAAIYRAANEAALYLWRFEQRGEADLPNFGSFAFLMLVGPIDEREDTEEDADDAAVWRRILETDTLPSYLASRNRNAPEEAAREALDDEREE